MERELWWIKIAVKDGNPELLDCMCMAHSHLQDACTFDCSTPEGQFFFFFFFSLGITGKKAVISKNSLMVSYCVCTTGYLCPTVIHARYKIHKQE